MTDWAPGGAPSRAPSSARQLLRDPTARTVALTGAVAVAGALVAASGPDRPLLSVAPAYPAWLMVAALGVAFLLAELGQALIEFRHQAYSFSLTGVPMVLGVLYCEPHRLIVVRVAAAAVAFAIQRAPRVKVGFNCASYLLDIALNLWLTHLLVGSNATLSAGTALGGYVGLALVDVLMSCLVLVVIRINAGPLSWPDAVQVLLPAAGFVAVNTTIGLTCAVLLMHGALGVALLALVCAITAVTYRGYVVLRRRHHSLEVIQAFIESGRQGESLTDQAAAMLAQVRDALRVAQVELIVDGVRVGGGPVTAEGYLDGLPTQAAIVRADSAVAEHRRWLEQREVEEVMVVPVDRPQGRATLLAIDRLGDLTRFTRHDLAILQALAGHLGVALHNGELVERLRYDATHDLLTGLANRALLVQRLTTALAGRTSTRSPVVILLDLDRFKEVNDALGHHVGDQLLEVVAERLGRLAPPHATVARLGGDEFVVLLPSSDSVGEALALATRLARALRASVDLPGVTVSTEASIGIARAEPGDSPADVMRHADTAMYAAKSAGSTVAAYSLELDAGRAERLALLADLHLALERGELELHYQPKLDLHRNQVTSVECLVRWRHPTLGPLTPDLFMPLAESTGLIDLVTQSVLAMALRQCRAWLDARTPVNVAVNLSARNLLNPDLPAEITGALAAAGVPADRLILEITESSVMGDPARAIPILEELAGLGITLSLDDFGTGYSSLSYLQKLPVKEVKIDRSFVVGLVQPSRERTSRILVEAIIGLGASLGLRVVAEGVEDAETLELLRSLGCDVIQGYFTGRPVPAADLDLTGVRVPRPRSGESARQRR